MIKGIGTDIVEIARIKKSIERQGETFLEMLFTEKERAYCNKFNSRECQYAGRFAAKESIAKALGTGIGKELKWHDIEILNDVLGKPCVIMSQEWSSRNPGIEVLISISHEKSYAVAFAVASC